MSVLPRSTRAKPRQVVLAILAIVALGLTGCSKNKAEAQAPGSLFDQIKAAGVLKVGTRVDNPPHSSLRR